MPGYEQPLPLRLRAFTGGLNCILLEGVNERLFVANVVGTAAKRRDERVVDVG